MSRHRAVRLLATVLVAVAATTASGHGDDRHAAAPQAFDPANVQDTAFGREGDPKKVRRVIRLNMTDAFRFTPSEVTVRRGDTVKFIVHNAGETLHEMVLGTAEQLREHAALMKKYPAMEHADANMAHVKPGADGEIVWQFTRAGEFRFGCLIPGHFEAGMVGTVRVK